MATLRETLKDHPIQSLLAGIGSLVSIISFFISLKPSENTAKSSAPEQKTTSTLSSKTQKTEISEDIKYFELNFSYPNEKWRKPKRNELNWIIGDWDLPSLIQCGQIFEYSGDKIRTKLHGFDLLAAYQGEVGKQLNNDWSYVEVYISNNGVLRFDYINKKYDPFFIQKETYENCVFEMFNRKLNDDGTYLSTKKIKGYNKKTCIISADGLTYTCKN